MDKKRHQNAQQVRVIYIYIYIHISTDLYIFLFKLCIIYTVKPHKIIRKQELFGAKYARANGDVVSY